MVTDCLSCKEHTIHFGVCSVSVPLITEYSFVIPSNVLLHSLGYPMTYTHTHCEHYNINQLLLLTETWNSTSKELLCSLKVTS